MDVMEMKTDVPPAKPAQETVTIEKRTATDLRWATPFAKELVDELEALAEDKAAPILVRLAARHLRSRATSVYSVMDCLNKAAFPGLPS